MPVAMVTETDSGRPPVEPRIPSATALTFGSVGQEAATPEKAPVKAPPRWLRRLFFGACLVALAAAVLLGLQTDVSDPQPDWALGSPAFERVAVSGAFFFVFYVVIAVLYLAAQGRPLTKFGVGGATVEAPDALTEAAEDNNESLGELKAVSSELETVVRDHENRLRRMEGLPPLPDSTDDA